MTEIELERCLKLIGKNIKEYRRNVYKISIGDLCGKAGVSKNTIYNLENGQGITLANLILVMDALGILKGGGIDFD